MGKKPRITLYLSSVPTDGGKFQYSLSILEAVSKLQGSIAQFEVIYYSKIWESIFPKNLNGTLLKKNLPIVKLIKNSLFKFLPNTGRSIWRVVGKWIDANHKSIYHTKPDLVIYAAKDQFIYEIGLPGIVPIFDLMHRYADFPELHEKGTFKGRELYYERLCKYAKGILVDSEVGKQHVKECYKVDANKLFVLPFIAPPYVLNVDGIPIDMINKFNLPEKFIFYPAQFWQHKNHKGLLAALKILKNEGVDVNCVLVGSQKNSETDVKMKVLEYGLDKQVFYLDYVSNDELVSLYKQAQALVMPTFLGPTNIPQLEAFALGCPVLTSNIYGIPEQVGDAGLLFDPENYSDIAENIKLILTNEDLRQELIVKGKEKARLNDSIAFAEKLKLVIKAVLNKQK
jgi:glycosyltransferase involved in cell wall biosynthesis